MEFGIHVLHCAGRFQVDVLGLQKFVVPVDDFADYGWLCLVLPYFRTGGVPRGCLIPLFRGPL